MNGLMLHSEVSDLAGLMPPSYTNGSGNPRKLHDVEEEDDQDQDMDVGEDGSRASAEDGMDDEEGKERGRSTRRKGAGAAGGVTVKEEEGGMDETS